MSSNALSRLADFVTDIVMGDAGVTSAKGTDGENIRAESGWHFGFYSRPRDGARGIALKLGGHGNNAFLIAFRDKQYELTLEKGECGMRNAFNATVLLNKDGEIVLNAGTAKIGRVGDATIAATGMTTWISAVSSALSLTAPADFGVINEGAPKVLA